MKSFSLSPEVVNNRKVLVNNMPFPDFVGGECEKKVTVTKEESKGESRLKKKKKRKQDSFSPFITIEVR